jgi:hypothetical protein
MVNWTAIFFVMLVMAYFAMLSFLENQHSKKAYISNDEFLASLAIVRKCSVYELFVRSGGEWRFSSSKIEADFQSYLKAGHIPHYVVNYVKQNIRPEDVKLLRRIGRLW